MTNLAPLASFASATAEGVGASNPSDASLVVRVRAGDDRAFELLYERYHRRIAAYVFGMVRDHGRAEDVAQEVFLSALRRMRDTDRPIAFKPWLYEIAKNACIDQFRRARRTQEVPFDVEGGPGAEGLGRLACPGPTPDVAVANRMSLDHLCGAFGGLSQAHHDILVMRELEGLSYREIGERMGMSRPGVESTLFRARRRLTDEYRELVSGERCLRVQQIVGAAVQVVPGVRDQRRLAAHLSHCQPCRRHARVAGLDANLLAGSRIARAAAFLPLPLVLRRRIGVADVAALPSSHAASAAQWSVQLSAAADPSIAVWAKAAAAAATLAVAGFGVHEAVKPVPAGPAGPPPSRAAPNAKRSAAAPAAPVVRVTSAPSMPAQTGDAPTRAARPTAPVPPPRPAAGVKALGADLGLATAPPTLDAVPPTPQAFLDREPDKPSAAVDGDPATRVAPLVAVPDVAPDPAPVAGGVGDVLGAVGP